MQRRFKQVLAIILSVLLFCGNITMTSFATTLTEEDSFNKSISMCSDEQEGLDDNVVAEDDSAGNDTEDTAAQEIAEIELSPFAGSSVSGNEGQAQKAENVLEETEKEEEGIQEETAFLPLAIDTMSTAFSGRPGDVVDFFVTLNREDVAVSYQWQRLYCGKTYDGEGQALYDYEGGESTSYIFPLEGMTEAELLEMNPDATF